MSSTKALVYFVLETEMWIHWPETTEYILVNNVSAILGIVC